MPDCAADRTVRELGSRTRRAKEQPAPAHVPAAHEVDRKEQPVLEDVEQQVHVLVAGDAAQEHDLDTREPRREGARVPLQGPTIAAVVEVDPDLCPGIEVARPDAPLRLDQARAWGDDPGGTEAPRVGELPAKVEATGEGEDVPERCARQGPQLEREREPCRAPAEHHHPYAVAARGREQEDSRGIRLWVPHVPDSTRVLNSRASAASGSSARPAWTGEVWITVLRGATSQWKRSFGGSCATGPAAASPAQIRGTAARGMGIASTSAVGSSAPRRATT